jgi:Icc-related predicted phosphoesterase
MTTVVCAADLHGRLPKIPECDLLVLAGDIGLTPRVDKYQRWVERVPAKEVVVIGGNMDQMIATWGYPPDTRGHYLEDSGIELFDLKIWGTPWTPPFVGVWNAEEDFLAEMFALVPDDTDVLVSHGPPFGVGDIPKSGRTGNRRRTLKRDGVDDDPLAKHVGSTALRARLDHVRPRLLVCGHIHHSYGEYDLGGIKVVNAAVADEPNRPIVVRLPSVHPIDPKERSSV